jgi:LysR family transcriptional regulator, benzoate and cis,cis-muconate-responsive activator of ben and cat genes
MEIRELRYFRAVVEAGSIMAAAATLHMSQPPLSLAIRKLEIELGVQLLTRSARGVQTTSAGRYLLEAGSRVLGDVDEITEHLRGHGAGTVGVLTVAAVPALMWARMPALLREVAADSPEVELRFVDPPPWTIIDMVVERKADLGFLIVADAAEFVQRYRDRFDAMEWEDVPVVAAFGPDRGDLPDPVSLSAFSRETLTIPRRTLAVPSLPDVVVAALAAHGVVPARTRFSETIQTGIPLIAAGLAASVLPDAGHASVHGMGLTIRSISEPVPPLTAIAICRRGGDASPTARRLFESLTPAR